jgi:hypothetical protein
MGGMDSRGDSDNCAKYHGMAEQGHERKMAIQAIFQIALFMNILIGLSQEA